MTSASRGDGAGKSSARHVAATYRPVRMRPSGVVLLLALAVAACGGKAPARDQQRPVSAEDARRCLVDGGRSFEVQGPLRREPRDTDAPDQTLVVAGRHASAYLGFYDDKRRAERSAREQVAHARQFDGVVDRHGNLTIVWVRGRETDEAAEIERCALA